MALNRSLGHCLDFSLWIFPCSPPSGAPARYQERDTRRAGGGGAGQGPVTRAPSPPALTGAAAGPGAEGAGPSAAPPRPRRAVAAAEAWPGPAPPVTGVDVTRRDSRPFQGRDVRRRHSRRFGRRRYKRRGRGGARAEPGGRAGGGAGRLRR